jgi:hypothetical protein
VFASEVKMGLRTYTLGLLLGLSLQANAAENITDDSYFYGLSPPVYPSRMLSPGPLLFQFADFLSS